MRCGAWSLLKTSLRKYCKRKLWMRLTCLVRPLYPNFSSLSKCSFFFIRSIQMLIFLHSLFCPLNCPSHNFFWYCKQYVGYWYPTPVEMQQRTKVSALALYCCAVIQQCSLCPTADVFYLHVAQTTRQTFDFARLRLLDSGRSNKVRCEISQFSYLVPFTFHLTLCNQLSPEEVQAVVAHFRKNVPEATQPGPNGEIWSCRSSGLLSQNSSFGFDFISRSLSQYIQHLIDK